MVRLQFKRYQNILIGVFYGKREIRTNKSNLDKKYEALKKYISTKNKEIKYYYWVFKRKIGNNNNGIKDGVKISTNG